MQQDHFLAEAEMFSKARTLGWSRTPMAYRRFPNLALAVKYAVEDMGGSLNGVVIRTDSEDLTGTAIKKLYDNDSFPLERKASDGTCCPCVGPAFCNGPASPS